MLTDECSSSTCHLAHHLDTDNCDILMMNHYVYRVTACMAWPVRTDTAAARWGFSLQGSTDFSSQSVHTTSGTVHSSYFPASWQASCYYLALAHACKPNILHLIDRGCTVCLQAKRRLLLLLLDRYIDGVPSVINTDIWHGKPPSSRWPVLYLLQFMHAQGKCRFRPWSIETVTATGMENRLSYINICHHWPLDIINQAADEQDTHGHDRNHAYL